MKWLSVLYGILSLAGIFTTALAQPRTDRERATLLKAYRESNQDSFRVQALLRLSKFHLDNRGEARNNLDSALQLAEMAKAYIGLNHPREALTFLEETVRHGGYDDARNKKLIAESIGNCYFAMKRYDKAEQYYLESLEGGKRLGTEQQLVSYLLLGKLYVRTKQYEKAK